MMGLRSTPSHPVSSSKRRQHSPAAQRQVPEAKRWSKGKGQAKGRSRRSKGGGQLWGDGRTPTTPTLGLAVRRLVPNRHIASPAPSFNVHRSIVYRTLSFVDSSWKEDSPNIHNKYGGRNTIGREAQPTRIIGISAIHAFVQVKSYASLVVDVTVSMSLTSTSIVGARRL